MAEPNDTSSADERDDNVVKDTVEGVATGLVKGVTELTDNINTVTMGGFNAVDDAITSVADLGALGTDADGKIVYVRSNADRKRLMKEGEAQGLEGRELEDYIRNNTEVYNLTDGIQTVFGDVSSALTQFAVGWIPANRALSTVKTTTKVGTGAKRLTEGAFAEAIAFDEDDERLSNIIQEYPHLENPITAFLQADPDDGFAEAKLKQALEGAAIEGTIGTVILGLKAIRAARRGSDDTAQLVTEAGEQAATINNDVVQGLEQFLTSNETIRNAYEASQELSGSARTATRKQGRDDAVAEMTPDAITDLQSKGGAKVVTNDEMIAQAQRDLAIELAPYTDDVSLGIQKWVTRFGGDVVAARQTLVKATQLVDIADQEFGKVAARFRAGEATDVEVREAFKAVLQVTNVARGGFSEAGRMLEFAKVVDGWNVNALNIAIDGGTVFADNLTARKRFYANLTKYGSHIAKAGEKGVDIVNELFINSILSGVKTHLVNIGSNTFTMALRPMERLGGAALRLDGKEAMNALRMYQGLALYSWQSLKGAGQALRKGKTQLDLDYSTLEEGLQDGAIPGLLGQAIRLPTRALAAEDELFKQMNFRAFVYSEAVADAKRLKLSHDKVTIRNEGMDLGLRGRELQAYVDEKHFTTYVNNRVNQAVNSQLEASITGKVATDPLAQRGIQYAREATFTQNIEKTSQSMIPGLNMPQRVGYSVQKAVSEYPILRQINPFIRTPLNLLSFTAQRSPLAPMLSQRWRDDFMAGGQRASEATFRWTVGSGLAFYFYNLANSGVITGTGSGLSVDQKKGMQSMYGYSDNAVYTGEEYYNVARLSPATDLMSIMASISELERYGAKKEAGELAMAVGLVLSDFARDKSFLQGMNQFINAVEGISEDGIGTSTEQYLGGRMGALVPYSGFLKQFNNDPSLRRIRDMAEGYKKTVPGLSQELDPVRNILGEVTAVPEFWGMDFLSPIGLTQEKDDALALAWKEAADAGMPYNIGMPDKKRNGFDLTDRKYGLKLDGTPVNPVKPQQTPYDRLLQRSRDHTENGLNLREQLTALVKDPRFQTDATFDYRVGDKIYTGSKVDLLKKVINHYRDSAWKAMVGRNPYAEGSTNGQFNEDGLLLNVGGAEYPRLAIAYWTDWKLKNEASLSPEGQEWMNGNAQPLEDRINGIFGVE